MVQTDKLINLIDSLLSFPFWDLGHFLFNCYCLIIKLINIFHFKLSDGVESKPANGAVNKSSKNVDDPFNNTKRNDYTNFNKTLEASKKDNKEAAKKPGEDENESPRGDTDGEKKTEKKDREGLRIYKLPLKPKQKKTGKDKNKVDTTLNTKEKEKKDADELELGAEASNIKNEDKKDGDKEEEEQVIEVYDCWPLPLSRR